MSEVHFCPQKERVCGLSWTSFGEWDYPLPETNTSQELQGLRHLPQKERIIFQASIFRCELC